MQPSGAESVPHSLPALMRAFELSRKLAWDTLQKDELVTKVAAAKPSAAGVGEMLLALVNYARGLGVNPELALRDTLMNAVEDVAARKNADAV